MMAVDRLPASTSGPNPLVAFFDNPAVRFGIKYALAGTLAFFVSLWLRLDVPTWSLLTAMVLMLAQYVGAVAEKSFLRLVGTVVGAVLGFLITGLLEQSPVIFLLAIGTVVAISITMFGQSRAPYAFFLLALTVVVVASNGMADPAFSWQVALSRTEEVAVGVLSTMLVTSLIWPRFAGQEFRGKVVVELHQMIGEFQELAVSFLEDGKPPQTPPGARMRVAAMRTLLNFGARESSRFRHRLPTYSEITVVLAHMAASMELLQEPRQLDDKYRAALKTLMQDLVDATMDTFVSLSRKDDGASVRNLERIHAARAGIDNRMGELRKTHDLARTVPAERALDLGGWLLAIQEIGEGLEKLRTLLLSLPEEPVHSKETITSPAPPLDPFWIRNGIRAGIAVMVGLLIQNWLQPPGGAMITLATFVFSSLTRLYPGGEGDRRAFHYAAISWFWGLLYIPVMLLMTPLFSEYLVLNTLLFSALFLYGFLSFGIPGLNFAMQVALLTIIGTVGLNGQEPVGFQAIVGVYFGIMLGILVSALIQRLLWPVLPQWQLRDRLLEWIAHCQQLTSQPEAPLETWRAVRLAMLPGEVHAWISVMNKIDCPPAEREHLRRSAESLARLGTYLRGSSQSMVGLLPAENQPSAKEALLLLKRSIHEALVLPKNVLLGQELPLVARENLASSREDWIKTSTEVRTSLLAGDSPHELSIRIMGQWDRALKSAGEGLRVVDDFCALTPSKYMGDTIL
ncbi:MAG: FUSC family protein [Terrimicrobiaceae bacterium]